MIYSKTVSSLSEVRDKICQFISEFGYEVELLPNTFLPKVITNSFVSISLFEHVIEEVPSNHMFKFWIEAKASILSTEINIDVSRLCTLINDIATAGSFLSKFEMEISSIKYCYHVDNGTV